MTTLDTLKNEFSDDTSNLSLEAMAIAVKSQQEIQHRKGRVFNCVVLDNDIEKTANSEFIEFFKNLNLKKNSLPNHTRFQVLYKTESHWSAIDIHVENQQLELFFIDAANDLTHILHTMAALHQQSPQTKFYYFAPIIQHDKESCAYFALNHAVSLSKLHDLYEQLPGMITKGPIGDYLDYSDFIRSAINDPLSNPLHQKTPKNWVEAVIANINYISFADSNLPKTFGSLIKNIQSRTQYDQYYRGKYYQTCNNTNLDDYVDRHIEEERQENTSKTIKRASALLHKKKKTKIRALEFLNVHENDYQTIIAGRNTLSVIELPPRANTFRGKATEYIGSTDPVSQMFCEAFNKLADELDRLEKATTGKALAAAKRQVLLDYESAIFKQDSYDAATKNPVLLAKHLQAEWLKLKNKSTLNKDRFSFTWLGPATLFIATAIAAIVGLFCGKSQEYSAAFTPRLFGSLTRTERGVASALKKLSQIDNNAPQSLHPSKI